MASETSVIKSVSLSPLFHLLFVNYDYGDKKEFFSHCTELSNKLLRISPFNEALHGNRISVRAHDPDSAFTTTTPVSRFSQYSTLMGILGSITIHHSGGTITGTNIWANPRLRRNKAICILSKNTARDHYAGTVGTTFQPRANDDVWKLGPFILMFGPIPAIPADPPIPADPLHDVENKAQLLAHELGHIFSLSDEYDTGLRSYPLGEPGQPNVTIDVSTSNTKVRDYTLPSRLGRVVKSFDHPAFIGNKPNVTDSSGADLKLFRISDLSSISSTMRSNFVAIRHPSRNTALSNTPSENRANYNILFPNKLIFDGKHANFFEGAAEYREGIYRFFSDCKMRHTLIIHQTTSRAESINFCAICKNEIRRNLYKKQQFLPVKIKFKPRVTWNEKVKINSTMAASFLAHVGAAAPPSATDATEFTFLMFESFYSSLPSADWPFKSLPIPLRNGSGKTGRMPVVGQYLAEVMIDYWFNNMERLRNKGLTDFGAMGAPAAMIEGGFGSLVNEFRFELFPDPFAIAPGGTRIYAAVGLTPDDMANLQPGSILQVWRSEHIYKLCVVYVSLGTGGITPVEFERELPFMGAGDTHSLIFVEYVSATEIYVADHLNKSRNLITEYAGFPFRIAAQWYNATGL